MDKNRIENAIEIELTGLNLNENSAHKMAIQQVLRVIVTSIWFSLSFLISSGQIPQLKGEYLFTDASSLNSIMLKFESNNHYSMSIQTDLGSSQVIKGYYIQIEDTLILIKNFENQGEKTIVQTSKRRGESTSEGITKRKISHNELILNVIVNNEENLPIEGASVELLSNNNVIHVMLTDAEGKFFLQSEGYVLDKIRISFFGIDSFELSLDDYWGFSTELHLVLHKNITGIKEVSKYFISKRSDGLIRLEEIDNSNIWLQRK